MHRISTHLTLILLLLTASTAPARWVSEAEADIVVERYSEHYSVRKNGSFTARFDLSKRIANETGRQNNGTLRLRYNSTAESLKIVTAEVTTNGETKAVPDEFIEDKPIASNLTGFDQQNQVLIAFPDVKVGSVVHVVYEWDKRLPSLPQFFSQRLVFHRKAGTLSGESVIESEMPIEIEINDPKQSLAVEKSEDGGKYKIVLKLVKPLWEGVVDESSAYVPMRRYTWAFLSSARSYEDMARATRDRYEAVTKEKLPELFNAIVHLAETERTPVDRVNAVTAALAERVRYMGDWRPRDGGFVPRPLNVIAETLFGDCKDLSAVTVAILRRLGMKASVAWIFRGVEPIDLPRLPGTVFNHAIVAVDLPDKTLWVDPTNFESFAQGVPSDLSGRAALWLGPNRIELRSVPAGLPEEGSFVSDVRLAFRPGGRAMLEQKLTHGGWAAVGLTGRQLRESKASIDRHLATTLFEEGQLLSYRVDPYDLTSRVVRDRSYRFTGEVEQAYTRTSAGFAYTFPKANIVESVLAIQTDRREADELLGKPYTLQRTIRLEHLRVVGQWLRGCKVKSPWVEASRKYRMDARGFVVVDEYRVLRFLMTNDELRSSEFRHTQEELRDCFDRVAVIFTLTPEAVPAPEDAALPVVPVDPPTKEARKVAEPDRG